MRVVTFYSYKGGVGRTLAAANFALFLASVGQRVVLIDFDLEAPGLDSKFQLESPPKVGLVDLILEYQDTRKVPHAEDFVCEVAAKTNEQLRKIVLLPAGNYFDESYYRGLNSIDWARLFSNELDGVGFFQQLMASIEQYCHPDFVVVDSRTGVSEIAGICTQVLADEVLMLSSLAAESIRMTGRIARMISDSAVAKSLGKKIGVSVVVTRVPVPEEGYEAFKGRLSRSFDIAPERLFVLGSSDELALGEYLAVSNPIRDAVLTQGYLQIFFGLAPRLAEDKVVAEIASLASQMLSLDPEEIERRVFNLTALFPHEQTYRAAMRFFVLRQDARPARRFAAKVLRTAPSDPHALSVIGAMIEDRFYAADIDEDGEDREELRGALLRLDAEAMAPRSRVILADRLEDYLAFEHAFALASRCAMDESLELDVRRQALGIALRCSIRLERTEDGDALLDKVGVSNLPTNVNYAPFVARRIRADDPATALELSLAGLAGHSAIQVIEDAIVLAKMLNAGPRLEAAVRRSRSVAQDRDAADLIANELRRAGYVALADELRPKARKRSTEP